MRWLLAALLVASGCGGSCGRTETVRPGHGPVSLTDVTPKADVPLPGPVYRDALEAAKRDISRENAEERLAAIERAIDAAP